MTGAMASKPKRKSRPAGASRRPAHPKRPARARASLVPTNEERRDIEALPESSSPPREERRHETHEAAAAQGERVRISEVLAGLSLALDLTEGQAFGHSLRSCLIALRLGEMLDLPLQVRRDLYYGALLKDAGCSSNAGCIVVLFASDD